MERSRYKRAAGGMRAAVYLLKKAKPRKMPERSQNRPEETGTDLEIKGSDLFISVEPLDKFC